MNQPHNTQVVLVNSNRWKQAIAPLAIDHLAAALEAKGISYEMLDLCLTRDPVGAIRRFFESRKPRLIGVSFRNLDDVLYGMSFLDDLKRTVELIRSAAPESAVVLGGSGFSVAPEAILDYCGLDLGVSGEGEEALPLLCSHLGDAAAYPSIPGLVYRGEGGFVRNPQGAMSMDGFTLAGTSRPGFKLYHSGGETIGSVGIQTKRGCAGKCAYCVVPNAEGRCRRLRPPGIVVDEIEESVKLGATRFFIADSEFNEPERHAIAICEEIIKRGLESKMQWTAYTSCIEFSTALATMMKCAGCRLAIASFDSACDDVLEKLGKRHRRADIDVAMSAAQEAGLPIAYCPMIGGPGETLNTLLDTISFLTSHRVKVTVTEPVGIRIYPNTPMADYVFNEGFESKNPNLWGMVKGNEDLLRPVYYISAGLGAYRSLALTWRRITGNYYRVFPKTRAGVVRGRLPRVAEG